MKCLNTLIIFELMKAYCSDINCVEIKTYKITNNFCGELLAINLSQYELLNAINCAMSMEIIDTKYRDEKQSVFTNNLKIQKHVQHVINVNDKLLHHGSLDNIFYADKMLNDGNVFSFSIHRNDANQMIRFVITLKSFPNNIGSFKVKNCIKFTNKEKDENNNNDKKISQIFKYSQCSACNQQTISFPMEYFTESSSFTISGKLLEVKDIYGSKIKKSCWDQFDIL